MFDATRRSSFERAELWITEVEKCSPPLKLLIGNKIDLANERKGEQITKVEAVGMARKHGMEYFEAPCFSKDVAHFKMVEKIKVTSENTLTEEDIEELIMLTQCIYILH